MADERFDVAMIGPYPEDPSFMKGGVQASVYGLSLALRAQAEVGRVIGISIPLAAEPGRRVEKSALSGIEVMYLTAPYRFLASCVIHVPRVLRMIKALNRPVAHVHGTGLFQTIICLALRFRRIPFVWTLHGITEKEMHQRYRADRTMGNAARYTFYTVLERLTLFTAKDIFVDTPYVEREIRTRNRVHVLPIGIFVQDFATLRDSPRRDPYVLSLGVIDPRKGHHLTIRAFAKMHAVLPEARLTIAGSLTVPFYLDRLKELAAKLNIANAVEFAVNRPRSEIIEKLKEARVFALHSQEESQGIALCESLAAGLPIVATRVGGIPYVVTEGEDGLLTEYGDVPAFAEAMTRLVADIELHTRMSANAAIASERFDWKTIARKVVAVYAQASAR